VLDNQLVELGTQGNISLFYRLFEAEGGVISTESPRFRYKPRVTLMGKASLVSQRIGVNVVWCHHLVNKLDELSLLGALLVELEACLLIS
jgi:hypothetical protein